MEFSKTMLVVFAFGFQFFVFGAIIFFLVYANRKKARSLAKLALVFGGTVSNASFYPTLKAKYAGRDFSVVLTMGGKNTPPYLTINLFKGSFFKLSVYKESLLSRWAENIGILREVKTTDQAFDSEFLIFSDKPDQAVALLYDSSLKEAFRGFFGLGFDLLSIDGKKLSLRKPNYNVDSDLEPARFQSILENLNLLAQRLQG